MKKLLEKILLMSVVLVMLIGMVACGQGGMDNITGSSSQIQGQDRNQTGPNDKDGHLPPQR